MRLHPRPRGFTIIEVMVVVAIIIVLAAMLISVNSRPYGVNPARFSEQLVQTMNLAKMRSVSTRRWHRVEVTGSSPAAPAIASSIVLWQWSDFGMGVPSGTCVAGPPIQNCWQVVDVIAIPSSVAIASGSTTIAVTAGTASVTPDTTLDFNIDFRPDGSSTGGTVFIHDSRSLRPWRVLVYRATGSSYARELW